MKRLKKGWVADRRRIEDGYMMSDFIVYAETRNKAKYKMVPLLSDCVISQVYFEENMLDPITYLNVPIIRSKEHDKYEYDGGEYTKGEVAQIELENKRQSFLDSVLKDDSIKFCYISKGAYYAPGYCGYTSKKHEAGIYSKYDAVEHVRNVRNATVEPININFHNAYIQEKIEILKKKLI